MRGGETQNNIDECLASVFLWDVKEETSRYILATFRHSLAIIMAEELKAHGYNAEICEAGNGGYYLIQVDR